jgi:hypothetical protein
MFMTLHVMLMRITAESLVFIAIVIFISSGMLYNWQLTVK